MLVEEVMSTELVTCEIGNSLRQVARRLLENDVGSVIVTNAGQPRGIVTESDVIRAGYLTEHPFSDIPVQKVMSAPFVRIRPGKPLRWAVRKMEQEGIKKLVVMDDLELVGIVTSEDVVMHYSDIKSELHEIERGRRES